MAVQRRARTEPSALQELENLAESAGYTVVGRIEQVRAADSRYQIGAGKVKTLIELVKEADAKKIIFDNSLKPVQVYNLAKATGVEVIDRFQLILEIFATRATTREAKLQIQLARMRYELTHSKEKVRLARMEEQPGFMGLGAYEVDVYYETVKRRVQSIRRKLWRIRKRRALHRSRRIELGFPVISLAGYTNAGKTSLFNGLTLEEAPVDAGLFTTLSTTTRLVEFSRKKFLLTDTVGFINRLPLTLIEAFHSTLEETIFSDLILLVVDISEPSSLVEKKLSCCLETIQSIGASAIPITTALNKMDLLPETRIRRKLKRLEERAPNPVIISALNKTNLEGLKKEILQLLRNYVQASITVPITSESMSFISWLFDRTDVQKMEFADKFLHVVFEAIPWFTEKVKRRVEEELEGEFEKNQTVRP